VGGRVRGGARPNQLRGAPAKRIALPGESELVEDGQQLRAVPRGGGPPEQGAGLPAVDQNPVRPDDLLGRPGSWLGGRRQIGRCDLALLVSTP